MDVAVGAAHWVRERALRKTNAGMPYCLCSLYCKTDRGYESRARSWRQGPAVRVTHDDGEEVAAQVAEVAAVVAAG
jgi:hypothetical protein